MLPPVVVASLILVLITMATATMDPPATPAQKAVFCHYLPWYTLKATATDSQARHGWCGVGTAIPAAQCINTSHTQYMGMGPFIGEYSQRETNVLEYHLLLAQAASLDAFIVNINPSNALQVELTKALFVATSALQQQSNSSTSFNLQLILSYDNSAATTAELVEQDFKTLLEIVHLDQSFPTSILFQTREGSTVFQHWSENLPSQVYQLAKQTFGNHSIVVVRNPRSFQDSDSNFEWPLPLSNATVAQLQTYWGEQALKDFEWGMANNQVADQIPPSKQNLFSVGCVYPGFDDGKVPVEWNGGVRRQILRYIDGASGQSSTSTYTLTWEHALSYVPERYGGGTSVTMPWLQIVTWNDFPEGTTIEPNKGEDGLTAYLATLNFTRQWHGKTPVPSSNAVAVVPAAAAILNARRTMDTKAEVAVRLFLKGDYEQVLKLFDGGW